MFKNCKIIGENVNSDAYHGQEAARGTPAFAVSPSSLKLFMECPSRWKHGYQPPDSDAKEWGSLLDTLLLTPEQFDSRYAVKPLTYEDDAGKTKSFNMNSTTCKTWVAEQDGKEIISAKELVEAQHAVKRLKADETIKSFLESSAKQVHVKGEWHDKATGLIIPVQCLIDCVPDKESEFQKTLGDLKTTRNAGQRAFQRWCYTAKYHVQAAFDIDLYQIATRTNQNKPESGEDRTDWVFILQENFAPYETGRRLLSQDAIQIGRQTYQDGLSRYAQCLKTGNWRGYDQVDEFSIINPEPHWEYESLSDSLENQQSLEQPIAETDDLMATA